MVILAKSYSKKIGAFLRFRNSLKTKLFAFLIIFAVIMPIHFANAGWLSEYLEKEAQDLVFAIVAVISYIVFQFAFYFVKFGAWLVDIMLTPGIYSAVLNIKDPNSPIMVGWATIRDFSNMFFILLLLLIAFSTILRIQKYNAKNLLPKFIIALFLINFSAVIAGLVIDFGQIFMYEIRSWMGTFGGDGGASAGLTSIIDKFDSDVKVNGYGLNTQGGIKMAFYAIFTLILGCVYIMLAGFLLVRLVALAMLIVLSPLAFLGIVMPGLTSVSGEWWKKLFEYSLFGAIFIFFVYLASNMANSLTGMSVIGISDGIVSKNLAEVVKNIVPYTVSLGMLLAVIPVTRRLGIAGADKLIGGTMGIGKIAMGTYAGMKLAGKGAKKAGGGVASRNAKIGGWVDKAKEGHYKNLERIGMRGAAMKGRARLEKEKEEKMKKIEMDFGDLKSIDLNVLEDKASGKLGTAEDKALWLKAAAAQGKLGEKQDVAEKFMKEGERELSKKDLGEVTDKNLYLATTTRDAQTRIQSKKENEVPEELRSEFRNAPDSKKEEMIREQIMKEKMADLIRDGKAHEVQGLDDKLAAKVWHSSQTAEQRKSSMNRMAKDQKKDLSKGYLKNTFQTDADYSAASDEDKRKDMEYRINAVKLGEDLEKSFTRGGRVVEEEIEQAFSKLSAQDIAKLKVEDIKKYGYSTTSSQIKSLNRAGEYGAIDAIRSSKEDKLNDGSSQGVKVGAIGGIKTSVDYDKAKADLETAQNNLTKEMKKTGGDRDPARIKRLKRTIDSLEKDIKPLLDLEKDLENIDDFLTGKSY